MTKLTTFILFLVVFLTNTVAQDLPTDAITRLDIGAGPVNASGT